jgi:hypothetical protein
MNLIDSPSFPSGHTTCGYMGSILLAVLILDRYPEISVFGGGRALKMTRSGLSPQSLEICTRSGSQLGEAILAGFGGPFRGNSGGKFFRVNPG